LSDSVTVTLDSVAEAVLHEVERKMLADALRLDTSEPITDPESEAWVRLSIWPPTGWGVMERTLAQRIDVDLPDLVAVARSETQDIRIPSIAVTIAPEIVDEVVALRDEPEVVRMVAATASSIVRAGEAFGEMADAMRRLSSAAMGLPTAMVEAQPASTPTVSEECLRDTLAKLTIESHGGRED